MMLCCKSTKNLLCCIIISVALLTSINHGKTSSWLILPKILNLLIRKQYGLFGKKLKIYGKISQVYFVEDNIWTMDNDGELRLTIMATLAQEESRKTSERVRVGQKISRDNGVLYGNGNILGYDRLGDTYVINEEQAETIRIIYELYLKGYGFNRIVNELVRLKRKDSSGLVRWEATKVSRILHNATYKGYQGYYDSIYAANNKYLTLSGSDKFSSQLTLAQLQNLESKVDAAINAQTDNVIKLRLKEIKVSIQAAVIFNYRVHYPNATGLSTYKTNFKNLCAEVGITMWSGAISVEDYVNIHIN